MNSHVNPPDQPMTARNTKSNNVPIVIHGRLRPQREVQLSLNAPESGWMITAITSPMDVSNPR